MSPRNPTAFLLLHDLPCTGRPAAMSPRESNTAAVAAAREICQPCPALQPCRDWAIAQVDLPGVAGGLTATERSDARRRSTPGAA